VFARLEVIMKSVVWFIYLIVNISIMLKILGIECDKEHLKGID